MRCATWTAPATSAKEMLHPGSRFQMAGDLLETYLLWLIEAHAHASEAGRMRIRPGHAERPDRYGPSAQLPDLTYRREWALGPSPVLITRREREQLAMPADRILVVSGNSWDDRCTPDHPVLFLCVVGCC